MSIKLICISSWEQETGKTLFSRVLMRYFAQNGRKVVFADFKEDNDYLSYFKKFSTKATFEFSGHKVARVDTETCIHCGICKENCKYQAIIMRNMNFAVNSEICEGCGECVTVCPLEAITLVDFGRGRVTIYESDDGLILKTNSFAGEIDMHLLKFAVSTAKEMIENDNGIVLINTIIEDNKKLRYFLDVSDLMIVILYKPDTSDLINAEKLMEKSNSTQMIFIVNRLNENFNKENVTDFLPTDYTFFINNFNSKSKFELIDLISNEIQEDGLVNKINEIINANTSHQIEV